MKEDRKQPKLDGEKKMISSLNLMKHKSLEIKLKSSTMVKDMSLKKKHPMAKHVKRSRVAIE